MSTGSRRRAAALLGACVLGASGAFWLLGNMPTQRAALEQKTTATGETRPLHVDAHGSAREQNEAQPRNMAPNLLRLLAQAARDTPEDEHTHELTGAPHPITADHQRLYRDVDLLHAADQAIRLQRYAEARALLAEHHRALPGMSPVEEEGLLLLADCAELRSPASVASVQQFYDRHTASTVRRQLRRGCLEQESP